MSFQNKFLLLLFASTLLTNDSARILGIFSMPSISHQVVFRPLTQELAKRGHEVTVITTDPAFPKGEAPANLTEIDVHDLSYNQFADLLHHHRGKKEDTHNRIKLVVERISNLFDMQMQTAEVQEILKKDKNYYDLILVEACITAALGVQNIFNAPMIQISSFGTFVQHYDIFGAPIHPFLYPTLGSQRLYNLTIWEKGEQLFKQIAMYYMLESAEPFHRAVVKKHFGDDVPSFEVLAANVQLLILNEHRIWADNRPVTPNIAYIGGIHQPSEKELPQDLKDFLDSSVNGVVYVSFGSNVIPSLIPPKKVQIMMKVFSEIPYDFLLKWDKTELPGQPQNVKIYKWFPQADLLKHPKVKLFITQGGLQSTDEAINAGVPVIGIPMLADQWYNTEKYVHHKIGLQLDIETLNVNDLKNSIEVILKNPSYKENMLRLRALMRDHPIKPLDLAVWWSEHIIKYGGKHLKSPAAAISWAEYYELKLVSVGLSIILILLCLLYFIFRIILKCLYQIFIKSFRNKIKQK